MAYTQQVLGNTGCLFLRGSCIPFYEIRKKEWILLDSGPRFVRQELEAFLQEQEIRIRAVVCSHAHFDHTENNRYLQQTQGARIVMSALDAGMVQDATSLKACFYSYSGQENEQYNRDMLCKADQIFLPWQGERTDAVRREQKADVVRQEQKADSRFQEREEGKNARERRENRNVRIQVEGVSLQVLPLPGHAASHVGFVTPDGVAYLADSVFRPDSSGRERLTYMLDWTRALKTLEAVREFSCHGYILAHGGVYQEIRSVAEENLERFGRMMDGFCQLFAEEITQGELLEKAGKRYHLSLESYEKICLTERVIRSMTEYLVERGRVRRAVRGGRLVYGPGEMP